MSKFESKASFLQSGSVSRSWDVVVGAQLHTVQLQHNTLEGSYGLSVDGQQVPGAEGTIGVFGSAHEVSFVIEGKKGVVKLLRSGATEVTYTCRFEGHWLVEQGMASADGKTAAGDKAASDGSGSSMSVKVVGHSLALDQNGKKVVWYKLETTRKSDGHMTMVHHRFSDFLNMHEAVLGSYAGTALYATLPTPPSRGFTLFQDHFASDFIENRRLALARFMAQMEGIPRMRSNVDFVSFLGFSGRVREASVVVPSGPLGLKVEDKDGNVTVAGFLPLPNGKPGAIQQAGPIGVGYRISRVSGEAVLGMPYEVLMAKLKVAGRPLLLHFLGLCFHYKEAGQEPDRAGAGAASGGAGARAGAPSAPKSDGASGQVHTASSSPAGGFSDEDEDDGTTGAGAGAGVGGLSEPASSSSSAAPSPAPAAGDSSAAAPGVGASSPAAGSASASDKLDIDLGADVDHEGEGEGGFLEGEGDPFGADASPFGDDGDL